jgi:WD40 repeat protein
MPIVFSPDGKQLASSSDDSDDLIVQLWNTTTGAVLQELKDNRTTAVIYSPDDKQLASASDTASDNSGDSVIIYNSINWITAVAFSPDSKQLASGSRDGRYGSGTLLQVPYYGSSRVIDAR